MPRHHALVGATRILHTAQKLLRLAAPPEHLAGETMLVSEFLENRRELGDRTGDVARHLLLNGPFQKQVRVAALRTQ